MPPLGWATYRLAIPDDPSHAAASPTQLPVGNAILRSARVEVQLDGTGHLRSWRDLDGAGAPSTAVGLTHEYAAYQTSSGGAYCLIEQGEAMPLIHTSIFIILNLIVQPDAWV